ncbi:hypothetical protein [Burkholderia sp. IDO3]|uniref:hypothetical protein n=1 Tax=Burkholderia sp. IDO3 TaxID=1705310 RepID=UPI0013B46146|nr:hypothetical protein [Burkholderia sp. IDO3]
MLQTVKKGSSLHVVGRSTARIGGAAGFGTPRNGRECPPHKARGPMMGAVEWAGAMQATPMAACRNRSAIAAAHGRRGRRRSLNQDSAARVRRPRGTRRKMGARGRGLPGAPSAMK